MTIAKKIQYSTEKKQFTLHKEGLFYKCYNEDAMVFVQKVKEYKTISKFVKNVGAKVHSIEFPKNEIEKGNFTSESISEKIGAKSYEVKDENIVFLLKDGDIKNDYKVWIETLHAENNIEVVKEPAPFYNKPGYDTAEIISMIKDFDLANSTPMQGLNFIQLLKSELNKL